MTNEQIQKLMAQIKSDYDELGLPPRMWGAVQRYMEHGISPGHFLCAVIDNNLSEAVGRADQENQTVLNKWVMFFYNAVPGRCWKSQANRSVWIEQGGLQGGVIQ